MKKSLLLLSLLVLSCNEDKSSRVELLEYSIDSLEKVRDSLIDRQIRIDFGQDPDRTKRVELTDQQIRELRKNDPSHIYQTSGRIPVLSEDEEFNRRAEQYIEDNYEEILDEHGH